MSASISPDRVPGMVLLVNDVFGTHTEKDAKRLHRGDWEAYVDESGKHLDESAFLNDAEKSELLSETIDRVLISVGDSRAVRAVRLRFGIDGQFRTLEKVGEELDPERTLSSERPRQLVARGVRRLRHPARRNHLLAFYGEKTTAEIRSELQALPQPAQRSR